MSAQSSPATDGRLSEVAPSGDRTRSGVFPTDFEALWTSRRLDRNMLGSSETTGYARGRYAAVGWNTGMAVYQKRHSGEYPSTSGVYVLGTGWTWVYIGESNDMLRRLLELFESPTPCIAKYGGLVFGYELVPTEGKRLARHDQLIRELVPACNQPLG